MCIGLGGVNSYSSYLALWPRHESHYTKKEAVDGEWEDCGEYKGLLHERSTKECALQGASNN